MTDIVKRLRIQSEKGLSFLPDGDKFVSWGEAADEIERLRLENQMLRKDSEGQFSEAEECWEETSKLKAENERLRAGLEDAANSLGWCARRLKIINYEKPPLEFEQKARAVLEGK